MINRMPWWDLLFLTVLASAGITAWQRGLAGYLRGAVRWFAGFSAGCCAAYLFGWYSLLPLLPVSGRVERAESLRAAVVLVAEEGLKSGLRAFAGIVRGLRGGSVDGGLAFLGLLVALAGWCTAWAISASAALRRRNREPGLLDRLGARVPRPWGHILATAWAVSVRLGAVGVFVILCGSLLSGLCRVLPPSAPVAQLAGNLRGLVCGSTLGRLGAWLVRAVLGVFL